MKNKIKHELSVLKKEINIFEYIFWWLCRIVMICVVISTFISENSGHFDLQMRANLIFLFILPTLHLLPRKYFFLARLNYRVQTIVCFMVVATSYAGNYLDWYGKIWFYDTFIHFVAGVICVPVGYYIMLAMSPKGETHSPFALTVGSFGLSCFASLLWECYEFVFDSVASASTQGWGETPNEALLKHFTVDPMRYPLFDTMTDALAGLAGAIVAGCIIRLILESKNGKPNPDSIY